MFLQDKMVKIYCKNCKWFQLSYRSCDHNDYKRPRDFGRGEKHANSDGLPITKKVDYFPILGDYDKYNKDNNCIYYKEREIYKRKNKLKMFLTKWLKKLKIKK